MNRSTPATSNQTFQYDPERAIEAFRKLAANRSPYFAWRVIEGCVRHKKPFPDWVTSYLGQCAERMCAERMQSERAKRADDAGKMFLWIFDFPKKKPGPGELLDAEGELLKEAGKGAFALSFALRLYQGEGPVEARSNAGNEYFPDKDDKTLQRYLREQFRLKKLPRDIDEWGPVIAWDRLLPITKKLAFADN
jgi:hypothetical protein